MSAPAPVLIGLGLALRQLRAERRLSQEEVGLRSGVHRNYVGGIERGERNPSVMTIARLAAVLQTPLGELFALADRALTTSGETNQAPARDTDKEGV